MTVTMAALCDYAIVREQLLTVVGGGISFFSREEFPSPMGAYFVLGVVLRPAEDPTADITVSIVKVAIEDEDNEFQIAALGLGLKSESPPDGVIALPNAMYSVADLRDLNIPEPGPYEILVSEDGNEVMRVPFFAHIIEGPPETE